MRKIGGIEAKLKNNLACQLMIGLNEFASQETNSEINSPVLLKIAVKTFPFKPTLATFTSGNSRFKMSFRALL